MRFGLIALLLIAGSISADESEDGNSYLCVASKSTGFAFNDRTRTWEQTIFRIDDQKYIVRPVTTDDRFYGQPINSSYAVWTLGKDNPELLCKDGISEHSWLHCGGEGNDQFTFNSKTNRYTRTFHGGYMTATFGYARDDDGYYAKDENGDLIIQDKEDEGGDTPYIEIGKCSPL